MIIESTDPPRAALLILHMQPPLTALPGGDELVSRVANAADIARRNGIRVLYINVGFRPGYPELSADDPLQLITVPHNALVDGISNAVHEALAPRDDDLQFVNRGNNAFYGCDLDCYLRLNDINHIVITGVATGGVVMGTVTDADDRNYAITVLSDGVLDPNPVLHEQLLDLFTKPARTVRVISIQQWFDELAVRARISQADIDEPMSAREVS
jgi:nicotinamidase-related amidase